ncbi:GtrA family protein [Methylovorus sp. SPW-M1]
MTNNTFPLKFIKFGVVGVIVLGFDALTFWLLLFIISSPLLARVISVSASICFSWLLNRSFTFQYSHKKASLGELGKFALSQLPGAIINAMVSVLAFHFLPYLKGNPWIAVAIGSCAGMILNFSIANFYVFKK